MAAPVPSPLAENAGLAFRGEPAWPAGALTEREAAAMLRATNACGRPNADVLRRRLAAVDGEPVETWQIDFPAHFALQEAMLYERPSAHLRQRASGAANPAVHAELRRALARLSRFLALPVTAAAPDWRWIEDEVLPDDSLAVVAREDDFTHGLLTSRVFACWRNRHPGADWVELVASFPFPWAPATQLGALSKVQEEARHAVARAARSGDADALDRAVPAAYGWNPESDADEVGSQLAELHRRRLG